MPISFDTDYFLRAGDRLPPRNEGIVLCDDPECRVVSFYYSRQMTKRGGAREVKELLSGVFSTDEFYDEGTAGKIYTVYLLDSQTGKAAPNPAFVIKVMPVSIDQIKKELECLQRIGFAASGSMEEERSYIVMPYLQGVKLETVLNPPEQSLPAGALAIPQLTFVERLNVLAQVVASIQNLHENFGLLHRDITLRNFLLSQQSRHGLKVVPVDYGDAASIEKTDFTWQGRQAVLHLAPETLLREYHDSKSDVHQLAPVVAAILRAKDPLKDKREAYLRAKLAQQEAPWQQIIGHPLNLEGLDQFTDWRIGEISLNFHAIVTAFIRRMEAFEASDRSDIDEAARFFRYLYYVGAIRHLLLNNTLNNTLPESEVKRFNLENVKYTCMLILLASGKWKQAGSYDCSQVNFDSSFGFCENVMTDAELIGWVETERWEDVRARLTEHLGAIEGLSEAVLFNAADQRLLETLELDFVNTLNVEPSSVAIPVDVEQFTAFFSRLNQLRQCLDPLTASVFQEDKKRLVAELLVVMYGCWKNHALTQEDLPEADERVSFFVDELCLNEYPELYGLIYELYKQELMDAQVLQRLIDQLPFSSHERSLSFRLRQYTQKEAWERVLSEESWDRPVLFDDASSCSSSSSASSSSSLPRTNAVYDLRSFEEQAMVEKEQEAKRGAQEIMGAILTAGFFANDAGASSGVRSRSLSLTAMVDGEE